MFLQKTYAHSSLAFFFLLDLLIFTNAAHFKHPHMPLHSIHRRSGQSSGGALAEVTNSTSAPLFSTDIDAISVVDSLVLSFRQTDPKFNTSNEALKQLLESAKKIKDALTSPSSSVSQSQKRAENITAPIRHSVTLSALEEARAIVERALTVAGERNARRVKNPRLNHYFSNNNTNKALKARSEDNDLLFVNATVADAAAIVAEADAMASLANGTSKRDSSHGRRAASFWMEDIAHSGHFPFGPDSAADYPVFRNVKDPLFGAVGDGIHDDTAAINKAISYGKRCGDKCGSSSVKGAVVYFPSGTYLVSTSIISYYNTQLIGNANNPPTLIAAKKFIGLGLISSDVYTGEANGDGEWYINQNNFLRQIRNFIIDISKADLADCSGIHWQVAQATSIQDVTFIQSTASSKSHMGIFAENGSGGFMSDLTFKGGAIGIRCGNQQFTTRNFRFEGCKIAIDMLWDWGWTWKSLYVEGSDIAINMINEYRGGSIFVLDSKFANTVYGIVVGTTHGATDSEQFSINIDNLVLEDVTVAVVDIATDFETILPGGSKTISSWTLGRVYNTTNSTGKFQNGISVADNRPESLTLMGGPNNGYFERSKPQYKELVADDFLNAKIVAQGDGVNDDSVGINFLLLVAQVLKRPVYFPMGSYIIEDTLNIPAGSHIVGECWSQIVAHGSKFADMKNPYVAVRVGDEGSTGVIEIQDIMFTAKGATAGVILMEWNVAQTSTGEAAMWDTHFRLGGAAGTNLQASDCPKNSGTAKPSCAAGSMMLHMTKGSTGYLENVWAWVADHDLDSGLAQTQIDIYVARGILIESSGPSWFYGTSSEHAMLYQYQISGAKNIFMGMIQTESPYFAPAVRPPTPFETSIGMFENDPNFSNCAATSPKCSAPWGLRIISSNNIQIAGAGLYNWFYGAYSQVCVDTQDCQQRVVDISSSTSIWLYNLYTIGTIEMINSGNSTVFAKDNTNTNIHPFTSALTAWLGSSAYNPEDLGDDEIDDDPLPPCEGTYGTLDAIIANISNIPTYCRNRHIIATQATMLDSALSSYLSTVNSGYDGKFDIYAKHVKALVPSLLMEYARKYLPGSGFFTCQEYVYNDCCKCSPYLPCSGTKCAEPCTAGYQWVTAACPSDIPDNTNQNALNAFAYTCTNRDGFNADILAKYGIASNWVVLENYTARIHAGCWQQGPECAAKQNTIWTGFPLPGTYDVDNPKDAIKPVLENRVTFRAQMENQAFWSQYWLNVVDEGEIADGASLPIFMTLASVASMDSIVKTADDITEQERKETILDFVSAILLLIPGVGAAIDATILLALRRILLLIGDIGNVALTIYDVVNNPEGAAFAIFGLLLGGSATGSAFAKAAAKRRGLTSKEHDALPNNVRLELDKINTVRAACVKI